jgi:arsenate reductase
VLFVCRANRGRSVMSEALLERAAGGRHVALSAGSEAEPGDGGPHRPVVAAMAELGIDVAARAPVRLTPALAAQADVVVTMGCGDACPVVPGTTVLDWELPDPRDEPIERVREIRDDIARRVDALVGELDVRGA